MDREASLQQGELETCTFIQRRSIGLGVIGSQSFRYLGELKGSEFDIISMQATEDRTQEGCGDVVDLI